MLLRLKSCGIVCGLPAYRLPPPRALSSVCGWLYCDVVALACDEHTALAAVHLRATRSDTGISSFGDTVYTACVLQDYLALLNEENLRTAVPALRCRARFETRGANAARVAPPARMRLTYWCRFTTRACAITRTGMTACLLLAMRYRGGQIFAPRFVGVLHHRYLLAFICYDAAPSAQRLTLLFLTDILLAQHWHFFPARLSASARTWYQVAAAAFVVGPRRGRCSRSYA